MSNEEIDKEIEYIIKNKDKILGIGEVGLDLHTIKDSESFEKQKEILSKFIKLAKKLKKPIFIHSREAEEETIRFLEDFDYNKIVMHCFSGSMNLVKRIIENNWFLSIPSSIKYNNHFQKIVEIVPIERLFCETDSPFLHPNKERDNNSYNVVESYKMISYIKRMSLDEVKKNILENFDVLMMTK
jgi:TatD DNase family protein